MSEDTLSEVLRTVRLRGALFFHVDGAGPWAAEAPSARSIIQEIMPGAEHLIEFHGVLEGACWAGIVGEAPIRLEKGDIVLFPQGDPHVVSSAPGMRPPGVDRAYYGPSRPPQLPHAIHMTESSASLVKAAPAAGPAARVVCGFLGFDAIPFNPLISALPRVLHVTSESLGPDSWVSLLLRTVATEANARRPGGEAVLERMSEMLFVEVIRCYVDSLPPDQRGWLAGMRDPAVGRVLSSLHDKPELQWTLESLAKDAAMSRTSLHERFVQFIGMPPMQYLTKWRMQLASGLLRASKAKIIEVALSVGYESEAAFSRAFKRETGLSPGAWRKQRLPSDPEPLR
ncbi:MAG TPA: AraC family transcriptional regulator [Holophagaceae bacterium]|nr:AraC family transcriptional regulator [Holophagaceae bacterium]